jgi:hypothetical protein
MVSSTIHLVCSKCHESEEFEIESEFGWRLAGADSYCDECAFEVMGEPI